MPDYKDTKKVRQAYEEILKVIKPGDVVNQLGDASWYEVWSHAAHWAIRQYQKSLFGKNANWHDTHTMLFFDEWDTFSVELPRARVKPLQEYCLSDMSIYRLTLIELAPNHIDCMMDAADRMIGTRYDVGQLLDIAIREILEFDQDRPISIFDFGRERKVCSVGVRVCFEYVYRKIVKPSIPDAPEGKWLFHSLNPDKWPPSEIAKYKGTNVEATAPAHFANTDYFQNEYELVARFKDGNRIP
jgi:hypothetical protein